MANSQAHVGRIAGTMVATLIIQVTGLLTGALVARHLGVHDRGILAIIIIWPSVIAYLGDIGGPVAYTFLAARRRSDLPALTGTAFAITLTQSIVLTLIGVPLVLYGLSDHPDVRMIGIVFLVLYLPINLLTRYLNAINQGSGAFTYYNAVRLTVQLSYAVGILTLVVLDRADLRSVVAVTLASNVCAAVLALLQRFRFSAVKPRLDPHLVRAAFRFGWRAHLGMLTPIDSMQLDLLAVALVLGARDAGLYAIAVAAAMIVRAQGTAFGMVALPTVAAAPSAEARRVAIGRISRLLLVINLTTALVLMATAGYLIPAIYGGAFAAAVPLARILALGMVAASMRQVLGDCLRGAERPLRGTLAEFPGWVVGLLSLAVLMPLLGATGAAVAAAMSYLAALCVTVAFVRQLGIPMRDLFLPRRGDLHMALEIAGNAALPLRLMVNSVHHVQQAVRGMAPWHPSGRSFSLTALAAAAAAGSGLLVAALAPTPRMLLIAAIAIVLAAPLVMRVARRRFDLFEPLTVMVVALAIMFVIRPIAVMVSGRTVHLGYDILPQFDEALFVALAGCTAFVAGYALPWGRRIGSRVPPLAGEWHPDTTIAYALALAALGIALYAAFLVQVGGVDALRSFLSGRSWVQDAWFRSSTGYLYQGLLLTIPAGTLLLAGGMQRRSWALVLLAVTLMVPAAVIGGATGGRLNLMLLFAGPVTFVFLYKNRRPGWRLALIGVYLVLTVGIGFLGASRNADARYQSRPEILLDSLLHPEREVSRLFTREDTEMFDTLANILSAVPEQLSYQHGALITDPLIRMVPRPLWPTKPLESNDRVVATLWPRHYASSRAAAASSIIGSFYVDSGLFSVLIGMLLLGVGTRALWAWFQRWHENAGVQVLYASVLPLVVVLARGNIVSALSLGAFSALPIVVGTLVAQRARSTGLDRFPHPAPAARGHPARFAALPERGGRLAGP